ncbi:urease accessory protein [Raineyella antarctica]|uniref:Urease accessory protein UreF n=1 Tax=Raineyella antarctica TaxID=1577474 RepID=A0A1G6HMA4_9ACTN|nr:urease accessory UreF family protein [Raineyella antarctica]SDB95283.1 urease accessory protein [Raineyella antarctica]
MSTSDGPVTPTGFTGTPESFLGALQLADSLFPSGRYTLSHGLEMCVESGLVHDAGTLEQVVIDYLSESVATCEAVAVATAVRATGSGDLATLVDLDRLVHAMRLPWEVSSSSVRTGRQLVATGKRLAPDSTVLPAFGAAIDDGRAVGSHAVVLGIVSAAFRIDAHTAVLGELYAYTAALLGAALRLMRLDHLEAQVILRRIQPAIVRSADLALRMPYQDMRAFAPTIDIMQMRHERSRMRLFAS